MCITSVLTHFVMMEIITVSNLDRFSSDDHTHTVKTRKGAHLKNSIFDQVVRLTLEGYISACGYPIFIP